MLNDSNVSCCCSLLADRKVALRRVTWECGKVTSFGLLIVVQSTSIKQLKHCYNCDATICSPSQQESECIATNCTELQFNVTRQQFYCKWMFLNTSAEFWCKSTLLFKITKNKKQKNEPRPIYQQKTGNDHVKILISRICKIFFRGGSVKNVRVESCLKHPPWQYRKMCHWRI